MRKHFSDIKPMEVFVCNGEPYRKLAGVYCVLVEHCCSNDTKRYVNCISSSGALYYLDENQTYVTGE